MDNNTKREEKIILKRDSLDKFASLTLFAKYYYKCCLMHMGNTTLSKFA